MSAPLTCRVNVIIDPKASDQSFSIRYGVNDRDRETISLKFVIPKHWQAQFMVRRFREIVAMIRPCNVEIGKCPTQLIENTEFQELLRNTMYPINCENFTLPIQPQPNYSMPFPPPGFAFSSNAGMNDNGIHNRSNMESISYVDVPAPVPMDDYVNMDNVDEQRARRSIATMKIHVKEYGAHPDFKDIHTEKNRRKIWNYLKSSLAIPSLNIDEALYIASRI